MRGDDDAPHVQHRRATATTDDATVHLLDDGEEEVLLEDADVLQVDDRLDARRLKTVDVSLARRPPPRQQLLLEDVNELDVLPVLK